MASSSSSSFSPSTNPPPNLSTITSRASHTLALQTSLKTPTLIYVLSSSIPACTLATPKVIALARANPHVAVYMMELTAETSPMIKFGPWNTPIFILVWGAWCETVLGGREREWMSVVDVVEARFGEAREVREVVWTGADVGGNGNGDEDGKRQEEAK